jgi:hypothetical protein
MSSRRLILNAAGTLRAALARAAAHHQQQPATAAAAPSALAAAAASASAAPVVAPSSLLPSLARPFASAADDAATTTPTPPPSLLNVLKREIKHEKSAYSAPAVVASGPPAPFTLVDVPGEAAVSLKREYRGGETITVDCSVNLQDALGPPPGFEDDEDLDEEEEQQAQQQEEAAGKEGEGEDEDDEDEDDEDDEDPGEVAFNVTVAKSGGPSLVFECVSDGTYVDVRHVALESKAGGGAASAASALDGDDASYSGPVFEELDEELQDAFRAYLEARGVDEDLGEYLRWLLVDKEQREYTAWLEGVKRFVE